LISIYQKIIEAAFGVLINNLDPSQVARFWQICNLGNGDYVQLKDKFFANETVDSLYEKIKAEENPNQNPRCASPQTDERQTPHSGGLR